LEGRATVPAGFNSFCISYDGRHGGRPFYEIICQASNFIFWFSRNLQFFVGWFSGGSGTFLSLPSIRVDALIDHHIQHSPSGLVKPVSEASHLQKRFLGMDQGSARGFTNWNCDPVQSICP
jgi:hypothetical protein